MAPMGERGIILRTFDELRQFAELAVKSGAAPSGMTPGGASLAIQAGLERGLGPLGGLQFCTIIEGTLSWNAKGASALIRNSPVCKRGSYSVWVEGKGKKRRGVAVAHRVGYAEAFRSEFSMEDAERAGLTTRKNWIKYPDRQLQARAIGFLATDGFSDVLGGFPIEGEAADYDGPINVIPEPEPAPPITEPPPASKAPGPDPVLKDLEKSAPVVIELESTEPAAPAEETFTVTIPPTGAPEIEVEGLAQKLEDLDPEAAAGRPDELEELGLDTDPPAVPVSSLRSKLGVPPIAAEGTGDGHEAALDAAGDEGRTETIGAASETPETGNPVLEASEQPTPPHGIPIADSRAAHLQADAEIEAEDQAGLFNGKGKS